MRASDEINNNAIHKKSEYDKDVSSQKHDEIVLWLYKNIYPESNLFKSFVPKSVSENPNYVFLRLIKKIEHPITKRNYNNSSAIVGFADLYICMVFERLWSEEDVQRYMKSSQYYYKNDVETVRSWKKAFSLHKLFEIKTSVNIGETIRQIKYYSGNMDFRDYENDRGYGDEIQLDWSVCAPDFKNKDILLEQNIGFIEYKP
jgi:hypothetical protein